jgi:hypothetical protein
MKMLMVIQQSRTSYRTNNYIHMTIWLCEQGYTSEDGRSKYEYLRLRKDSSLIVVYYSGTVLLQGGDVEKARSLIQTMVETEQTADLPF